MNDEQPTCPHCGMPVSQKLLGMCPQCMLKAGLGVGGFTSEGSVPEQAASRFVPPTVEELGHYFPQLEIVELIGRGGMGAVYKARQKQLDRIVALKILPPGIGKDPAFADRFTREAKALAALAHPNIVTLYEFGQTDGLFFFLMEFIDGVNLRQLLSGGKLAPKEALAIVPQICDALQYAHDRGIVHRDIKPENILLGRDGVVKIADFGVAKIIGKPETRTAEGGPGQEAAATMAGVAGTPAYMAPEQGLRPEEVDHRADIYSLGVVFYQMLTGELPGKQIEPPSRKVQIDVRIDEIVMRALEHNPEMRYSQASVFKTEVETVAGTSPLPPLPPMDQSGRRASEGDAIHAQPQFSRFAIAGAAWLCIAIFGVMFVADMPSANAPLLEKLMGYPLIFLAATSPFGVTVLGWMAVTHIRRSAGRLYGLGLAVFDGLLFPLLTLDLVIFWLWQVVLDVLAAQARSTLQWRVPPELTPGVMVMQQHPSVLASLFRHHEPELLLIASGLTSVLIDWLVIRRVWRVANTPLHGQQQSPAHPTSVQPEAFSPVVPAPVQEEPNPIRPSRSESAFPSNRRVAWGFAVVTLAVHTVVFLALTLFAAFVIPNFESVYKDFRTELPLLTRMTMTLAHGVQGFWYLAIPLFVAANAGICLLLGYLNARRSLIGWLICGIAMMLAVGGAMFISLFLPMQSLIAK